MSLTRIDAIIEALRAGTYRWRPSRCIYNDKANGSQRPISIPSWSDKLVQEVMRMILEAYYEPQFRNCSHGFRPNRGCHTALRQIQRSWRGTKWFIEGDIKSCFDAIHPEQVLAILGRKIDDRRFLKLVREMLHAGYMEDWQYHDSYSGVPQGGIISPILSNIVLNELDTFVIDILIPLYTNGKQRKANGTYLDIKTARRKASKEGNKEHYRQLSQTLRTIPSGDPNDPNYRRLRYCRYADDFILGFTGPKSEARAIKAEVGRFLMEKLNLTLSQKKTTITHARTQKARFLGYNITTAWCDSKVSKFKSGGKRRSINGQIQLRVPYDVIIKWRQRYTRQGKPASIGSYINLSDFEIVETFGAQLRGLVNYYGYANNIGVALNQVRWDCMESARKTLAAKHRIRRKGTSYHRYRHHGEGSEWTHLRVIIHREGRNPLVAKCGETPLRTRKAVFTINDRPPPKVICGSRSELVTRLLKEECELCGKGTALEAHHINSLKQLQHRWRGRVAKPSWVQSMIARRRKTIVVCHECHQSITYGRYDGRRIQ
jgi:group II intron reverse transcriptase/maturase